VSGKHHKAGPIVIGWRTTDTNDLRVHWHANDRCTRPSFRRDQPAEISEKEQKGIGRFEATKAALAFPGYQGCLLVSARRLVSLYFSLLCPMLSMLPTTPFSTHRIHADTFVLPIRLGCPVICNARKSNQVARWPCYRALCAYLR